MIGFKQLLQPCFTLGLKQWKAAVSTPSVNLSCCVTKFRFYSQQNLQTITKPEVLVKKKRQNRKTKDLKGKESLKQSGFWNVIAVTTAEEYDLQKLLLAFNSNKTFEPSSFFSQVSEAELNFLHVVSTQTTDHEKTELFIFREGSMVAWNVSEEGIKDVIKLVDDYELEKYNSSVVHDEIEVMPYTYSLNSKNSVLQNGNICLTQEESKCTFDKYTLSNGMILSVKLGVWETLLDEYIESITPWAMNLKLGKPISISRKEILKKTGELYALKHSINLSSDLLDVPDFYWEREELEKLYLTTCHYFNIPKRTKVINDKLNHCIELVDLLSSHLSDRHHIRLEWMIIALITVEVGFEIIHYAQML